MSTPFRPRRPGKRPPGAGYAFRQEQRAAGQQDAGGQGGGKSGGKSGGQGGNKGGNRPERPPLNREVTTLWDYPSREIGAGGQGDNNYAGATPAFVVWNLIERFTLPGELVVDPFCGSGTTLDVARQHGREAVGFDLQPTRPEIQLGDARRLPRELTGQAALVFMDPPYSTHIAYSDDPRCIGKLDVFQGPAYFEAMAEAFDAAFRVLRPGGHLAVYVSDSYVHKKGFFAIGFELWAILMRRFEPVDVVAVKRYSQTLDKGNYRAAADTQGFFLRGFNYLLIVRKPAPAAPPAPRPAARSR